MLVFEYTEYTIKSSSDDIGTPYIFSKMLLMLLNKLTFWLSRPVVELSNKVIRHAIQGAPLKKLVGKSFENAPIQMFSGNQIHDF